MPESGDDISPVIMHRFEYDNFRTEFDALFADQTGKVVHDWPSIACADFRR
jgi:threonine 3-dehydrogenase